MSRTLRYTRCPVATATGVALETGLFDAQFGDGTVAFRAPADPGGAVGAAGVELGGVLLTQARAALAGSHLALVEPAGEGATTTPGAVRVLEPGRDLAGSEPYGQLSFPAGEGVLELTADPQRFVAVVQRQLKRSAPLAGLLSAPAAGTAW